MIRLRHELQPIWITVQRYDIFLRKERVVTDGRRRCHVCRDWACTSVTYSHAWLCLGIASKQASCSALSLHKRYPLPRPKPRLVVDKKKERIARTLFIIRNCYFFSFSLHPSFFFREGAVAPIELYWDNSSTRCDSTVFWSIPSFHWNIPICFRTR